MAGYIVIVVMSSTNPDRVSFPPEINMEFLHSQVFDAVDYYNKCHEYFTAAKRWDPEYYDLIIDLHFWHNLEEMRNHTLA